MSFAAQCFATIAATCVMVPGLFARDAGAPKAQPETERPPETSVAALPTSETWPMRYSSSTRSSAAGSRPEEGAMHPWEDSERETPQVEWFFGYSFWSAVPRSPGNRMIDLHGGSTSIAYNFNRYLGLVADFAGFDNSRLTLFGPAGRRTVDSDGVAYTYLFGPRFSYRGHERFTPFVQALIGGAHASAVTIAGCTGDTRCTPLGTDNAFTTMLGAGLDIQLSRHVALRLLEGDFLVTHFQDPFSIGGQERGWQKNVRLSTGIVFRFGGGHPSTPSTPITSTCTANREFVYAGSSDFVVVRAQVNNPDNTPSTYVWSATEGSVDGTGPEVRWNSAGRQPGTYTIKARVDSGRNRTSECSASIRVEARPNLAPTISCVANHKSVTVGQPVEITATASDPDNDPLSFSWRASGGRIEGSGPSARLQTANLPTGSYTVTGHVEDGRTGTADCTVEIAVQGIQVPSEAAELESRLALHSIYFPTARPTEANPTGGLLESQQKVLLALAADFHRYLAYRPEAHLTLEGHADRRGSVAYNNDLTERRVARTKSFLVEHGVPAANIETRALGKQENLSGEQVKQLVEQNPDLSNDERQRIERNLQVIVLANNRRVDIALSTTGQQSVRQYPFNAKDSLTLLSIAGGKNEKSARQPVRRKTTGR